jgi:hypothetical protein
VTIVREVVVLVTVVEELSEVVCGVIVLVTVAEELSEVVTVAEELSDVVCGVVVCGVLVVVEQSSQPLRVTEPSEVHTMVAVTSTVLPAASAPSPSYLSPFSHKKSKLASVLKDVTSICTDGLARSMWHSSLLLYDSG